MGIAKVLMVVPVKQPSLYLLPNLNRIRPSRKRLKLTLPLGGNKSKAPSHRMIGVFAFNLVL